MARKPATKRASPQRRSRPAARRRGPSRGVPGWVWLLGGLLLGAAVAIYVFFGGDVERMAESLPEVVLSQDEPPAQEERKARDYAFWEMLPNQKVEPRSRPEPAPARPAAPKPRAEPEPPPEPEAAAPQARSPSRSRSHYYLQAGAFRDPQDADALRARLALAGMESRIQRVTDGQSQTWHRVQVGPFADKETAKGASARLDRLSIDSFIVKASR
jgi:cell division protein FtsN